MATKRLKCIRKLLKLFSQVSKCGPWAFVHQIIKTSPVKQYSYENDFSGVFDALHQSFLVLNCTNGRKLTIRALKTVKNHQTVY